MLVQFVQFVQLLVCYLRDKPQTEASSDALTVF